MDLFVQRMVERFHDQVFQNMTPERKARNTAVMKALSQTNLIKKAKPNVDPLNNNMTLSCAFIHSTPVKQKAITNFDVVPSLLNDDCHSKEDGICTQTENGDSDIKSIGEITEQISVTAKIYELNSKLTKSSVLKDLTESDDQAPDDYEIEVTEAEIINNTKSDISTKTEPAWKSLEVLDTVAEHEFLRSLEHSKQYLSTSNLLEEIEANLPPNYSLAKPLNHTFHSLASYRTLTRLARMEKNSNNVCDINNREIVEVNTQSKRLDQLEMEAMVQQAKIKQAQKALLLSKTNKEMAVENLESEKTLLLANLRFNAACQEMEKIKLLGNNIAKDNFGQITISEVQFALDNSQRNNSEIFICTATEKENVQISSTQYKLDCKLCFDQSLKFQNLNEDFVIHIQLFRRAVKVEKTPIKACLMKKLKNLAGVSFHKSLTISPLFSHGFECVAEAQLRLEHLVDRKNGKSRIQFMKPPKCSVVGDSVTLQLKTDFNAQIKRSGFLNVFKKTWHRRWYSSSGHFLNSWLYLEDQENEKPPIDSIYLPFCQEIVKSADMELCIRPHSFVLFVGPERKKVLFAADSKDEMIKWIEHLNLLIKHIQIWKPNV